jgi:hypothetical protein
MPPRGNRLACSVKSSDGAIGTYDVIPGEQPNSIAQIGQVRWDRPTDKPVAEGAFTIIGDLGMTGQVILVNQEQWRALVETRLESFFYAAMLWGKSPFKVIQDAQMMQKRTK